MSSSNNNSTMNKRALVAEVDENDRKHIKTETTTENPEEESSDQNDLQESITSVGEKDYGIEEYISKTPGFMAILKDRFTDFLVNEVDLEDKVAHITELNHQEEEVEDNTQALKDAQAFFGDEIFNKIMELVSKIEENPKTKEFVLIPADGDKEKRKETHHIIKKAFTNVTTETVEQDSKKLFKVQAQVKGGRRDWPEDKNYTKFILYKENRDTMECIGLLSKMLKLGNSSITFAGTKDKRGVTTQWLTAFRMKPSRLSELNKRLHGCKLGNFKYCNNPLKLGDLLGNRFTIVMRNVQTTEDVLKEAVTSLKENGFINYFGMQRFGNSAVPTHSVGLEIIAGRWDNVCNLILKPREGDTGRIKEAREMWQTMKNPDLALKFFPSKCFVERCVLEGYKKNGLTDHFAAFSRVARNMRMMYVHSLQSLIWNKVVSRRIREFGMKPIIGDLVTKQAIISEDDPSIDSKDPQEKKFIDVEYVTEENIEKFKITDVVFPLPGKSVSYPNNETKKFLEEELANLGLNLSSFDNKHKEYALMGSYRKIISVPRDVEYQLFRYDEKDIQITQTDLDKLENKPAPQSTPDGKYLSLVISFTLSSANYATMAIRELVKMDTSASYQRTLSTNIRLNEDTNAQPEASTSTSQQQ